MGGIFVAIKIAFSNLKGGVGKTVSSTVVASILADRGFSVLLVDCDAQRNASTAFKAATDNVATLYDIIFSDYPANKCVQHTEVGDIIASDEALKLADTKMPPGPGMYRHLKKSLTTVEHHYDYIIFDTAPAVGVILGNVLMAVDYVICPIECELFCISGLFDFASAVYEFQEDNKKLKILGLLRVKYKKYQKLTKDLEETILPEYASRIGTKIFKSTIRESVRMKEAVMLRKTLFSHARGSTVAMDYNEFVDEMIKEVLTNGNNQ